jgi:spermidine/putrescine transport system substrate-binding protein
MNASRAWRLCRVALFVLTTAVAAALAVSCGGGTVTSPSPGASGATQTGALTGRLSLFGYEDGFAPQVIGGFEKANPALKVVTASFGTNDEAVAKMRAGFRADVVNVCVEETPRMVKLGLLQPLDTSRITQWSDIVPALQTMPGVVIDGKTYMVPATGGTGGIVYNPSEVPQGVPSWKALFEDPALKGRVTLEDSPATVIPVAALALGYTDPFHLTDSDLSRIQEYLLAHRSQIRTFFSGDADFLNLYKSGEIVAGFAWHDYKVSAQREGVPAEYVVPTEGQLAWVCGWGIATGTQNLDAAYAALNWYNSPTPQAFYAKSYTYWVFNRKTLDLLPQKLIDSIGLNHPEQLQHAIPLVIPDNYDRWLRVFQTVKSSG